VLLDNGADVDSQNNSGGTALHLATFFGHTETVRILLARGADPEVTNNRGQTPLDIASTPRSEDLEGIYRALEYPRSTDPELWRRMIEEGHDAKVDLERIKAAQTRIAELLRDPASANQVDAPPETNVEERMARTCTAIVTVGLAVLLAVTQLIGLLAARGTLGQFVFGFAVVDAAGAPASRPRLFARWLVAWILPVLTIAFTFMILNEDPGDPIALFTRITGVVALVAWFVVGLGAAVVRPARGLHDQWTGCWLVPR
jgi:hypothetical protein